MCDRNSECYPKVNVLISSVKKVFLNAPQRLRLFSQILPDIPLPPEPVITRWGTWINAANYYFVHFENVKRVIDRLDSKESVVIANAQEAVTDATVYESLREIQSFYSRIPLAIQQLERRPHTDDFSLTDQMNVIYDLRQYLSLVTCESAQRIYQKLENIFNSNPVF